MSSPQNSTRSGCSSVGGNTSRMPPRTANSPRFSTRSTRAYAMSASRRTTSSRSAVPPVRSSTGSRSPSPRSCGWSTDRTGATTTRTGPALVRVGQPAQYGQPPPDGVRARRQPLVRQRLPRRVHRDRVGRQQPAQRGGQVVGLPGGGGDGQYRPPGTAAVASLRQRRRPRTAAARAARSGRADRGAGVPAARRAGARGRRSGRDRRGRRRAGREASQLPLSVVTGTRQGPLDPARTEGLPVQPTRPS